MKRTARTAAKAAALVAAAAICLASCGVIPGSGDGGGKDDGDGGGKKEPTAQEIAAELAAREAFFSKQLAGGGWEPVGHVDGDSCLTYDTTVDEINLNRITHPVWSSQIWTLGEIGEEYPDALEALKSRSYYGEDGEYDCSCMGRAASYYGALDRLCPSAADDWSKACALLTKTCILGTSEERIQICIFEITDSDVLLYEPWSANESWYWTRPLGYNEQHQGGGAGAAGGAGESAGKTGSLTLGDDGTWTYTASQSGAVPLGDRTWSEDSSGVTFGYTYSGFQCEEKFSKSGGTLTWESTTVSGSDSATSNIMQSVFAMSSGSMTAE